jgi:tetratricopeptide (TPR) repeat protein
MGRPPLAPLVTATLIVRDEAAVLPRCLASIRGLVDEIVVVDTGSTDASPRIAAEFGARVVPFAWQDDFAAARNEALAHARGRWILYIDADEEARFLDPATLGGHLANPGLVASTVQFRPRTGFTRYWEYRLFRNDPRIRFRGVIHETMVPDIHAVARADGLGIGRSELALDHYGYDGDQRAKRLRDVPLLRERLARDPGHVYSWNHLGRALADLGDVDGAVGAWRRAVAIVRDRGTQSALDALPYGSLLVRPEASAEAPALLAEALACFPSDHLLRWIEGQHLLKVGRAAAAVDRFAALAAIDGETFCSENGVAYDARIFGPFAHEALALCYFRLGRYRESARFYARAEAASPDLPGISVKRRLAEARAAAVPLAPGVR